MPMWWAEIQWDGRGCRHAHGSLACEEWAVVGGAQELEELLADQEQRVRS